MPDKIAFLFLTRGEVNNVQVWERYFKDADSSKYRIVIHAKNPTSLTSPIWSSKNSTILKPIPTAWGTISLVKATIYLLQTAILDSSVTKFILLSEFCLPTTNFNNIYNTLISEANRSRINWTLGKNMDRYSIIKSYLNIPPHNWAKQSQWMCLDRKHVSTFLSPIYTNILKQQLKDYMYCPAPDEHFFINMFLYTVRLNSNEIINHPITFVDWSNNSKHPVTFNTIVKDVIELCRKNKIFFSRKFVQMPLSVQDIDYLLELQKPDDANVLDLVPEVPAQSSNDEIVEVNNDVSLEPIMDGQENIINPIEVIDTIKCQTEEPELAANPKGSALHDKQKDAVLNFFKDVLNNLSPQRIHTIYSALFVEDTTEENENKESDIIPEPIENTEIVTNILDDGIIVNPLDFLTLAIETIENTRNDTLFASEVEQEDA